MRLRIIYIKKNCIFKIYLIWIGTKIVVLAQNIFIDIWDRLK